MQIQWYPGHMAKTRRMLIENLKLIDVVVELIDARAPRATRNPDFDDLFAAKRRVIVLNKSDLADPAITASWIDAYRARNIRAIELVSTATKSRKPAIELIEAEASETVQRMLAKGVRKTVRAMVVGIPNVGKSTLINRIAGSQRAQVGDRPGVTRGRQWVRITPYLELMDTPGMLWPKLEDPESAKHLAYLGSINDEVLDQEQLAAELLQELRTLCPKSLQQRYSQLVDDLQLDELLPAVCTSRGFLAPGGELDQDRAARIVLDEFRAGKIGRITLERPEVASDAE